MAPTKNNKVVSKASKHNKRKGTVNTLALTTPALLAAASKSAVARAPSLGVGEPKPMLPIRARAASKVPDEPKPVELPIRARAASKVPDGPEPVELPIRVRTQSEGVGEPPVERPIRARALSKGLDEPEPVEKAKAESRATRRTFKVEKRTSKPATKPAMPAPEPREKAPIINAQLSQTSMPNVISPVVYEPPLTSFDLLHYLESEFGPEGAQEILEIRDKSKPFQGKDLEWEGTDSDYEWDMDETYEQFFEAVVERSAYE